MQVQITARHCEVSPPVRERARLLIEKLHRLEERISFAEVVFGQERHIRNVEVILRVLGEEPVVAHAEAGDHGGAVDQVGERLRKILRRRGGSGRWPRVPQPTAPVEADTVPLED
ncbi:MAG: HPF/RaiA family ribosome-associated protein [Gemmatimonadota bacterium]